MTIEENPDLPYVYFVRRQFTPEFKDCREAEDRIELKLNSRYNIISMFELNQHVVNRIIRDSREIRIHALVTHVPPNRNEPASAHESNREYYTRVYKKAIDLLWQVKRDNPLLPIIAYTGADHGREDIERDIRYVLGVLGPVNPVVFKSSPQEWEKDAAELEKILANPPRGFAPMTLPWGEVVR